MVASVQSIEELPADKRSCMWWFIVAVSKNERNKTGANINFTKCVGAEWSMNYYNSSFVQYLDNLKLVLNVNTPLSIIY